ncbi:MAG TPA: anthranilate phosphoribosyltransferase [Pyrinomonadaceae bacterium]|nr:anthranilate phosphoribosyltransferase [Pyrinomonadaceae bacterium]
MTLQQHLKLFTDGGELASEHASDFFDALINETDERLLADIFEEWHTKGTTENEVYELARIMRERCARIQPTHDRFVDVVGTGGSKAKTFNVSTAAAFVIAGAGLPVAKHGNKAATSNSGSADVLAALGVEPAVSPAIAEQCLSEIGICFMFAPNFHRLSPTLAKVRRGLGFPTIFNNLGPLCNPAGAPFQLIGVWDKDLTEKTACVLARLGTTRSWVVHGGDGLDEFTLNDITYVAEASSGRVRTFELFPTDFGAEPAAIEHLHVSSAEESAALIRSILENRSNDRAAIDLVLINSAAPLYLSGYAESLKTAYQLARESLLNGAAFRKLNKLAKATNA